MHIHARRVWASRKDLFKTTHIHATGRHKGFRRVSASWFVSLSKSVCHGIVAAHLHLKEAMFTHNLKICFVEASAHGTPILGRGL